MSIARVSNRRCNYNVAEEEVESRSDDVDKNVETTSDVDKDVFNLSSPYIVNVELENRTSSGSSENLTTVIVLLITL